MRSDFLFAILRRKVKVFVYKLFVVFFLCGIREIPSYFEFCAKSTLYVRIHTAVNVNVIICMQNQASIYKIVFIFVEGVHGQ